MDVKTHFKNYIADESGATAIEYGLIAALIGIAIIVGLRSTATEITHRFNCLSIELHGRKGGPGWRSICLNRGHS